MNISSASISLLLGTALLVGGGSARAAEGRIGFSGAVVEPTCGVDMSQPRDMQAGTDATHQSCGAVAGNSGRSYARRVVDATGPALASDPLLGYFASYAPAGAPPRVVVQTYD